MIKITIDEKKCNLCGICIKVCPKGPRIYEIKEKDEKRVLEVIDESFCIGCTTCVVSCKPKAIKIERK